MGTGESVRIELSRDGGTSWNVRDVNFRVVK